MQTEQFSSRKIIEELPALPCLAAVKGFFSKFTQPERHLVCPPFGFLIDTRLRITRAVAVAQQLFPRGSEHGISQCLPPKRGGGSVRFLGTSLLS